MCVSVKTTEVHNQVIDVDVNEIYIKWSTNQHMGLHEHICNTDTFLTQNEHVLARLRRKSSSGTPANAPKTTCCYNVTLPEVCVKLDTMQQHSFSLT